MRSVLTDAIIVPQLLGGISGSCVFSKFDDKLVNGQDTTIDEKAHKLTFFLGEISFWRML